MKGKPMFRFHRKMFHGWPESASRCVVVGVFGPDLFCVGENEQDAVDEWYERHGDRAEADDPAFLDFPGTTHEERFVAALDSGEIIINGGGTVCWTDDYLWLREFATLRDAIRYYRDR